ncbi:MAG TPA: hypothetical protein VIW69_15765, partial [Candidatus Elarobacter sp.]
MPWSSYFAQYNAPSFSTIDVAIPAYVTAYDNLVATTPLTTWKSYLRYHIADAYASSLPKRFADASFAFRSGVLSGVKEQLPRSQRCTSAADSSLRDVLGKAYVARTFSPAAKARALALVDNLQGVLHDDIDTLDWMSAPTKKYAQTKLGAFTKKIGYPDKWVDFSALSVTDGPYANDVMNVRRFEVARNIARLGGRRERARDVGLAEHVAQRGVGRAGATLRARQLFLDAAQHAAAEREARIGEALGQRGRVRIGDVIAQVRLPRRERRRGDQVVVRCNIGRDGDVDRAERRCVVLREVRRPRDVRRELRQIGDRHRVIRRGGIAHLDARRRRLRDRRLERDDRVGLRLRGRRRVAEVRQLRDDVGAVRRADRLRARVVLEIVVAVGQAQPTQAERRDLLRRVLGVGVRAEVEPAADADHMQFADLIDERGDRRDAPNIGEHRIDRPGAGLLDAALVHARAKEGADLLLVAADGRRRVLGGVLEDRGDDGPVLLGKLRQAAPRRMAGRDGVLLDPPAGSKLVEIVARFARRIEVARIEHRRIRGRPSGGGPNGNIRKRGNDERGKSHGSNG